MSEKKSFLLYADSAPMLTILPDEVVGKVIKWVFDYFTEGKNPTKW